MNKQFEELVSKSIVLDALSAEKEYKDPVFELPPSLIELEAEKQIEAIAPANSSIIEAESAERDTKASTEMTADAILAFINGLSFFGQNYLSGKFAKKLTAEQWFKIDQIKGKLEEDQEEDERRLLVKAAFNEQELKRLQDQLEITDKQNDILEKATKLWAEANNIRMGSNSAFLTTLASILGPKIQVALSA